VVSAPPPTESVVRLKAVLRAAAGLCKTEAGHDVARELLKEHRLQAAFTILFPTEAEALLDDADYVKADNHVGGVILSVEVHPNVVHIITNLGILTLKGSAITVQTQKENA
jgi:hypothetical protein